MEEYKERTDTISVPRNTGVEGFIRAIRGILSLPRVQNISVNATGQVSYRRYVRDGEVSEAKIDVDYSGLDPYAIIRNSELEEFPIRPGVSAASVIAHLFNKIAQEGCNAVAFVTGANSDFWRWHEQTSGVSLDRRLPAYGLPIYADRQIPDHALVLCAAYARSATLLDCHRFIAVVMGVEEHVPPETSVDIL